MVMSDVAGPAVSHRRREILTAALRLFRKQGFDRTSLREIADDRHLSKSGLYHHFSAKDQILLELVSPLLKRVEALLDEVPSELPDLADRERLLATYLDIVVEYRGVISLIGSDHAVLTHPRLGQRIRAIDAELVRRLSGPGTGVGAEIRATQALTGLQVAVVRYPHVDPTLLHDECLRAALAALGS